ncbi:WXG100-like domain-containing protein, partial [Streptomyces sp. NPDC001356]
MAIVVPAWLNDLFFALMGERMPQANEDLAYVSHEAFSSFSNKLRRLADLVGESIGSAGQVLPPQVAKDYVRAVDVLTDDGGTNHITELAKQLDDISDGRVKTSISIAESKINILLELAILAAELLFLAVMSFFTGGATSGEAVEAKLRTRARILVILEMLAKRTHLLPTLSEALEEAFTTLAARLALILTAAPGRKPHGIDMKDVVLSGVTGGLTSIFDHLFHGGKSLFKKLFKDKADIGAGFDKKFADKDKMPGLNTGPGGSTVKHGVKNPTPDGPHSGGGNLVTNTAGQGFDAVGEGAAETFAESVVYQQPLSFSTFHGAVVSSLNTALIFTGVQKLGLGLRDFVFPKDLGVTPNRASAGPATGPAGTGAVDGPDQGTHVPTTGTDVTAPVSYAPHDLTEAGPPPVTTTGQTPTVETPAVSAPTVGAGPTQSAGPAAASGYGGGIPVESPGQAQVPPAPTTSAGGGAGTRPPLQTGPDAPTAPGHDVTTVPDGTPTAPGHDVTTAPDDTPTAPRHDVTTAPDDAPTALAPGATTAPGATLTDSASGPLGAGAHQGSQGSATGDGTASHDVSPGPVEDESATAPGSLTTPGEDPSDAAGSVPGQTAPPASGPGTATGQAAAQTPGTAQAPGTRQ